VPRVTFVKAAQQRYEMVPVIDPATGEQKVVPLNRKDGSAKTTKRGREIVRRLTVEDRSKPLPNRTCDKCGTEIEVGQPYKWIAPKSGPYGGRKRYRCGTCPRWDRWEYSSSLSARLEQIASAFWAAIDEASGTDDVQSAVDDAVSAINEVAQEKREGAENMESGFGHATSQSAELNDTADQLENWAGEIEGSEIPDLPEAEEEECPECGGTGMADQEGEDAPQEECEECEGTGQITPEEPNDEQVEGWRDEVRSNFAIIDESPV
jgi:hypothetical protein